MRVFISINILQLTNYNVPKDVCKQGNLFLLILKKFLLLSESK